MIFGLFQILNFLKKQTYILELIKKYNIYDILCILLLK